MTTGSSNTGTLEIVGRSIAEYLSRYPGANRTEIIIGLSGKTYGDITLYPALLNDAFDTYYREERKVIPV